MAAGIKIACCSDVGVFEHGDNARELRLMVEHGMTPLVVIRSATVVAAEVLELDDLGAIRSGARSELVTDLRN